MPAPLTAEQRRGMLRRGGERVLGRWWRGEAGHGSALLELLLAPAEAVYRLGNMAYHGAYTRRLLPVQRARVPVISVGNLEVGGTGKTPVTRWLVEELRRRRARPAVLHGGYAEDEPRLHRAWYPDVPVIVGRDRVRSAALAAEAGADVVVLDDGFQHRRLARDLDLVLVAAESWTRRPRLLPRGPWREPPHALSRAGVVAVARWDDDDARAAHVAGEVAACAPGALVLELRLEPGGWLTAGLDAPAHPPVGPAVGVAGVAYPERFFRDVRRQGVELRDALAFPDHHEYSARELQRIRELAAGRPVVTTAKDAVKLRYARPGLDLCVLDQRVHVTGAEGLGALLDALLSPGPGQRHQRDRASGERLAGPGRNA